MGWGIFCGGKGIVGAKWADPKDPPPPPAKVRPPLKTRDRLDPSYFLGWGRTIIDTLGALCKTAIGPTPQAQRQVKGQTRHPLQAQSPGLGCIGPSSRLITRGNKTPRVNSSRRPQTNREFPNTCTRGGRHWEWWQEPWWLRC